MIKPRSPLPQVWAVKAKLWPDKPMAMLGVGWFGWPTEAHLQGCRIALFTTRREARVCANRVRAENGITASAVPVRITIAETADD